MGQPTTFRRQMPSAAPALAGGQEDELSDMPHFPDGPARAGGKRGGETLQANGERPALAGWRQGGGRHRNLRHGNFSGFCRHLADSIG